MTIDLYYMDISPPCRNVLLAARTLGLDLNLKEINTFNGEHLEPEFIQLNPQHTIPTINDNGFVLWDSHAITAYLVGAYGEDDSLYPKDLKRRAIVDQRLHFDTGVLYPKINSILVGVLYRDEKTISDEIIEQVRQTFSFLEKFLTASTWIAEDQMTIADFAIVSSVSTFDAIGIEVSEFPKLSSWYIRCKESMADYEEANQKGADAFGEFVKDLLVKNNNI